ncbi:MAG: hypothetical protein M2R45_04380 [Verrucomicrobia subdivision 3 bacterium]|nr:hypothetical protein [Limisphaerales bacterium]
MEKAGTLEVKSKHCPGLQLLSVPDILAGRCFELPGVPVTRSSRQTQLPLPTKGSSCP